MNPRTGMLIAALIGAAGAMEIHPHYLREVKPVQSLDDAMEKQRLAQEKRDRRAAKRIKEQQE
jgi:hypothetical protein